MAEPLPEIGGFSWKKVWEKYRVPLVLGLVGLLLLGVGILSILFLAQKEPEIEILPAQDIATSSSILVDLGGAVERPGVYELAADSRINDLLIKAGGLAAAADREWVQKNLNLAQKLVDGSKLYILKLGEETISQKGETAGVTNSVSELININNASLSQLDSLWGIGEARAQSIIDNRPYQSVEELKTKKIVPSNVYERIKGQITVY